ncbi:MAG: hypothetical protein JJU02_10100 [Cryomorphaceae bacterium]|nr:hypothetical protein [Cryomorphaceae bacterium]
MRSKYTFADLIIHSQIWVAIAAWSLTWLSLSQWNNFEFKLPLGVGLLTWSAYSYIRLMGQKEGIHSVVYQALKPLYRILIFIAFPLGVYLIYSLAYGWLACLLIGLPPAVLVLLYPLRVGKKVYVREIPGIKLSFIIFCWVWATVSIPALLLRPEPTWEIFSTHLQRLFFLLVWALPYDIRDMANDDVKMETIPQLIGRKNTIRLINVLIFILQLSFVLTGFLQYTSFELTLAYILGLEYLQAWVRNANEGTDRGRFSFWIESTPFVTLLLFLLLQSIFVR